MFRRRLFTNPDFGSLSVAGQYSQADRAVWAGPRGAVNCATVSLWYHPGVR